MIVSSRSITDSTLQLRRSMSLSPESTLARSGSQRERGLELLLRHLPRELPAHGEVRVQQVRFVLREPRGQPVRPAAERPIRVEVHEPLGRAVAESHETTVRHVPKHKGPWHL